MQDEQVVNKQVWMDLTTMSLLTLPHEILDIVFKDLDTGSFYNLYNTCKHLRNVIGQGVVKKCHLSEDETHMLKSSFFKDISVSLRVLDLSGLYGLDLPSLKEALRSTKNLVDLDVRETDIIMPDFIQIVKVVTSLKNIAINFSFGKEDSEWKLTEAELMEYQQAFKGFKNVHFIGETSTIYKKMALCMLEKAELCDLTLTCYGTIELDDVDWGTMDVLWPPKMVRFSKFQAHFEDDRCNAGTELPIFNLMDIKEYEIFIFGYDYQRGKHMINATPLVEEIMCENLDKGVNESVVEVEVLTDYPVYPSFYSELQVRLKRWLFTKGLEDVFIICWDRERTKFDSEFSAKLFSVYLDLADNYKCSYDSDSDFYYCY